MFVISNFFYGAQYSAVSLSVCVCQFVNLNTFMAEPIDVSCAFMRRTSHMGRQILGTKYVHEHKIIGLACGKCSNTLVFLGYVSICLITVSETGASALAQGRMLDTL